MQGTVLDKMIEDKKPAHQSAPAWGRALGLEAVYRRGWITARLHNNALDSTALLPAARDGVQARLSSLRVSAVFYRPIF